MQPFQQIKDPPGGGFVQVPCGLVGQQQPGTSHQGSRQRHALLLTAGKLAGPMV